MHTSSSGQALDGQVFAKLAILEIIPLKIGFPVAIGLELIHHHRAMLSTMSSQVSLSIAIDIETARHQSSGHGLLPDSGAHHLALPLDVARETHIH